MIVPAVSLSSVALAVHIAAVVVGLVLMRGYRQLAEQAAPSAGAPTDRDQALARRTDRAQLVAAGLVLFTIYVMTTKPFA